MRGLVCNGHTGEVMGLRGHERAEVTRIMADEVGEVLSLDLGYVGPAVSVCTTRRGHRGAGGLKGTRARRNVP